LCTLWAMFLACLRPVEGYEARFAHISLPQDRLEADDGLVYIYVYAPKTKWIAARKQYARFVDHEFVRFCAALRHFAGDRLQRVFVGGPAGLRRVVMDLCAGLRLPYGEPRGQRPAVPTPAAEINITEDPSSALPAGFVAASWRSGGCTYYFENTARRSVEDTLWHMRVSNRSTLERYLQEFPTQNIWRYLSQDALDLVAYLSPRALSLVRLASDWLRDGVSPRLWPALLRHYHEL
jgi:hypothetical protein